MKTFSEDETQKGISCAKLGNDKQHLWAGLMRKGNLELTMAKIEGSHGPRGHPSSARATPFILAIIFIIKSKLALVIVTL